MTALLTAVIEFSITMTDAIDGVVKTDGDCRRGDGARQNGDGKHSTIEDDVRTALEAVCGTALAPRDGGRAVAAVCIAVRWSHRWRWAAPRCRRICCISSYAKTMVNGSVSEINELYLEGGLHTPHHPKPEMTLITVYSSRPQTPPSRPLPLALTAANGAPGSARAPFISIIPDFSACARRSRRSPSDVRT